MELLERRVVQADPRERSRDEILDEHVARGEQPAEDALARGRLEIEHHAALAAPAPQRR
jgi:hypothetical protein